MRLAIYSLTISLLAGLAMPAAAQQGRALVGAPLQTNDPSVVPDWHPEFDQLDAAAYGIIPLQRAALIASDRFQGRLIGAQLGAPNERETARGVALVHELRFLTPARDVLLIRLDARTGAFLEVAGNGLSQARRKDNR